jgi:hypothetical protein
MTKMYRLASTLVILVLVASALPLGRPVAHAQVCPSGCDPGYVCAYDSTHTAVCESQCVKDGYCTLDEIVGTAPKKTGTTFKDVVDRTVAFFDSYVIPLLYALAFLLFMIGLVRYFFLEGEENRAKGRGFALWGLIGFVVLFGLWGIVHLLLSAIPGA